MSVVETKSSRTAVAPAISTAVRRPQARTSSGARTLTIASAITGFSPLNHEVGVVGRGGRPGVVAVGHQPDGHEVRDVLEPAAVVLHQPPPPIDPLRAPTLPPPP